MSALRHILQHLFHSFCAWAFSFLVASDSASTLNQFIRLGCWKDLDLGLSILPVQGDQLNLLRSQLSHIQGLGENLKIISATGAIYFKLLPTLILWSRASCRLVLSSLYCCFNTETAAFQGFPTNACHLPATVVSYGKEHLNKNLTMIEIFTWRV